MDKLFTNRVNLHSGERLTPFSNDSFSGLNFQANIGSHSRSWGSGGLLILNAYSPFVYSVHLWSVNIMITQFSVTLQNILTLWIELSTNLNDPGSFLLMISTRSVVVHQRDIHKLSLHIHEMKNWYQFIICAEWFLWDASFVYLNFSFIGNKTSIPSEISIIVSCAKCS